MSSSTYFIEYVWGTQLQTHDHAMDQVGKLKAQRKANVSRRTMFKRKIENNINKSIQSLGLWCMKKILWKFFSELSFFRFRRNIKFTWKVWINYLNKKIHPKNAICSALIIVSSPQPHLSRGRVIALQSYDRLIWHVIPFNLSLELSIASLFQHSHKYNIVTSVKR